MSLQRESGSIKRAVMLLAIPAVLAASVLSSAPAQAATSTAGAVVSGTDAAAAASVAQLTRAQLRAEVAAIKPGMRPAEVEAVTDLLATQAASAPQVIPAAILAIVARCALGSMGAVALNEIFQLITTGQTASAETRIASAIIGCLGRGLPPQVVLLLRNEALRKVAAAALVVAIRARQICIPRCI